MKIYVVEHRQGNAIECTVVHLASTARKALEFIKANPDFDCDNDWWWAVYAMPVDSDDLSFEENELTFLQPDGTVTFEQPFKTISAK